MNVRCRCDGSAMNERRTGATGKRGTALMRGATGKRGAALMGGLLGAFVTRMPYTNVTNSSSLLRESGQGLVNHLSYPEISRLFPQT